MPSSVTAQSSFYAVDNVFIDFPPGTYHTSDDDNDSVLALEEAPMHLRRNTNKDAPIIVESSSDEEDNMPHRAGPSNAKRHIEELGRDAIPERDQRSSQKSAKRRRKSTTAPSSSKTPSTTHSDLPSSSAGPSTPQIHTAEDYLVYVLEILPDIDSKWALVHITEEMIIRKSDNPANRVIEIALEMEEGYPKFAAKAKEANKIVEVPGGEEQYRSSLYKSEERAGGSYHQLCMDQLETDFPRIPAQHIRSTYLTSKQLYVPAYLRLLKHSQLSPKPYTELKRSRNAGKGKDRDKPVDELEDFTDKGVLAFKAEVKWLREFLVTEAVEKDAAEALRIANEEALADGGGIECGCCFGDTLLGDMIQCADGHLFCRECTTQHAETKLGEQSAAILCMDQSGCKLPFPESELTRLLSTKSLQLYHRLKQAKDLEQAEIEGLESCPNCPYAAVIDNPDEKLFRCMSEECGQVTCRACKRKEHIPRTCAEVEADLKLNNRHTVEDAMSEALIRKCPKCAKPYIKDTGCNKIMCNKCGTLSCYICQKAITGYDHFEQNTPGSQRSTQSTKCLLWDGQEKQHDEEAVRAARDAATARVLAAAQDNGINLNAEDINVALPDSQAPPTANAGMMNMAGYQARPLPPVMMNRLGEIIQRQRNNLRQLIEAEREIGLGARLARLDAIEQGVVNHIGPLRPLLLPLLAGPALRMPQQVNHIPNVRNKVERLAHPAPPANRIPRRNQFRPPLPIGRPLAPLVRPINQRGIPVPPDPRDEQQQIEEDYDDFEEDDDDSDFDDDFDDHERWR